MSTSTGENTQTRRFRQELEIHDISQMFLSHDKYYWVQGTEPSPEGRHSSEILPDPATCTEPQNFLISSHRTVSNSHLQKITACDLQVILNRQEGGFCWLEKQHVAQTYKTRGPEGRRRAGATPCSDKAGGSCLPRSCLRGRSHHQQPREETSIHPQERRFRVVVAAVEREE